MRLSMKTLAVAAMLTACGNDATETPKPPATVAVTAVTLNKSTLSLVEGTNETLTATVAPATATNKAVTWANSADRVVTVDAATGRVTAIKAGTATITVASAADATKTATCTITVTAPVIAVAGVALNRSVLSLVKGKTEMLTANVAPDNATDKSVTWKSSDEAVAAVDATGKVTAVNAGVATITAASAADVTKTATCTVTVNDIYTDSGVTIEGVTWATRNVGETPGTFAATPDEEGGIYDFHAAQTVCPTGWRTPSPEETEALSKVAGRATLTAGGGLAFTVEGAVIVMAPTSFRKYYWANKEDPSCGWEYGMEIADRLLITIAAGGNLSVGMVRCVRK